MHIDSELSALGQAISSFEANPDLTYNTESDYPAVNVRASERVEMKDRETELLEMRDAAVRELLPSYLALVNAETRDLKAQFEKPEALAEECLSALSTVVRAYAFRVRHGLERWNDVVDPLIQFSQGLPLDAVSSPSPEVKHTELGTDGSSRGIETQGREFSLFDVQAETDEFFRTLTRSLMSTLDEERRDGRPTTSSTSDIEGTRESSS